MRLLDVVVIFYFIFLSIPVLVGLWVVFFVDFSKYYRIVPPDRANRHS